MDENKQQDINIQPEEKVPTDVAVLLLSDYEKKQMEYWGVTPQEWMFAHYFHITLNKKDAAERAGYNNPEVDGKRLLKKKGVLALIRSIESGKIDKINKKMGDDRITAERILEEIANIALFNPKDCYDENGGLLPFASLPRSITCAIKDPQNFSKTYDKLAALDLLARHLGLLKTDIDINTKHEVTYRFKMDNIKSQLKDLTIEELEVISKVFDKIDLNELNLLSDNNMPDYEKIINMEKSQNGVYDQITEGNSADEE